MRFVHRARGARVLTIAIVLALSAAPAARAAYVTADLFTLEPPDGAPFTSPAWPTHSAAGGQMVGYAGVAGGPLRAMLWDHSGTPTDLTPPGAAAAQAIATDGSRQVGHKTTGSVDQTVLWYGTPTSAVDLHPTSLTGSLSSYAIGIAGTRQVGYGEKANSNNSYHALLWQGTAASAVDLHPTNLPGIDASLAYATNSHQQVGVAHGASLFVPRAVVRSGTADSAVDLHALLPAEFQSPSSRSYATGIDADGNIAGWALDSQSRYHAIEWVAPNPPRS